MIRILHIEEDVNHHEFIKAQLRRLSTDISLGITDSFEVAVSALEDQTYECVICDDQPSNNEGLKLYRKLREEEDCTPFIFLSDKHVSEGEGLGLTGFEDDEFNVIINYGHFDKLSLWIQRLYDKYKQHCQSENLKKKLYKGPPEKLAKVQKALSGLTKRELEILELIGDGNSNKDIAAALGVSYRTVVNHVYNLFSKLDVHSRAEAIQLTLSLKISDER